MNEIPGGEEAVRAAIASPPRFVGRQPEGVRVEEVFPPDYQGDTSCWSITLSYLEAGARVHESELLKSVLGSTHPKAKPCSNE